MRGAQGWRATTRVHVSGRSHHHVAVQEVSTQALLKRINRKLAPEHKRLCKSRPGGEVSNLGAFHLLDTYTNTVIDAHVSPAALAADLGVLGDREVLAE